MIQESTTNLTKISSIKITCNNCKTELILPVGRNNPIECCVSCNEKFPYNQILEFMNQFSFLHRLLSNDNRVEISLISKTET